MGRWGIGEGEREERGGISERKIGETGLSREGSVTERQGVIFDWREIYQLEVRKIYS